MIYNETVNYYEKLRKLSKIMKIKCAVLVKYP